MKRSAKARERRRKKRRARNPLQGIRSKLSSVAASCKGGFHKDRKKAASKKACRKRVEV